MELADAVLAPSNFVVNTIRRLHPNKSIALAPYGVDLAAWIPPSRRTARDVMTFLFVGQCSIRKGIPLLLQAWRAAGLKQAHLRLVGLGASPKPGKRSFPPDVRGLDPSQ